MAVDGITVGAVGWLDCFGQFGPGVFRLDMLGAPVAEDGGVAAAPDDPRMSLVSIPASFIDDCWVAVGYYRVPDEFNRGDDDLVPLRPVSFEARFIPDAGGPAIVTIFVDLVRPPVVFVHGLWSEPDTWTFPLVDDPVLVVRDFADYSGTAAEEFHTNREVLKQSIERALEVCRDQQILCTQVDVVGHSMGGLLTRIHTNSAYFASIVNRFHGNVRKIVTLDTPHQGSPLATFLAVLAVDPTSRGSKMRAAFSKLNMPIDQGAIFDLSTDSSAIAALQESEAPAHALVGVGGPDLLSTLFPPLGSFYRTLFLTSVVTGTDIFGPSQHDGVVGRQSQEGGLPATATTRFGFPDGIHFHVPFFAEGNTGSEAYSDRVKELLDTPLSEPEWSLLPPSPSSPEVAPGPGHAVSAQALADGAVRVAEGADGLTIVSPTPGTIVTSGAVITVVVDPDAGLTVDEVLVVGQDGADRDDEAPFEVLFTVPEHAFGPYAITAFGKNATTEEYYSSAEVVLDAEPGAALQSIVLTPDPAIMVGVEDERQLRTFGQFADGLPRRIAASEVTFSSSAPAIVTVDAEGLATSHAIGQAVVEATFQTHTTQLTIKVLPPPPPIFEDGFESGDLSAWSSAST